jgi:hypothetical protein
MVMMNTNGENYTLVNGTGVPAGFSALYVGGDGMDEVINTGVNAFSVWVLADDAEFEILAPAFDESLSYVDPANGTKVLVHASTTGANRGKIVPAGTVGASTAPVARLLKVVSPSKIIVGGLRGTV